MSPCPEGVEWSLVCVARGKGAVEAAKHEPENARKLWMLGHLEGRLDGVGRLELRDSDKDEKTLLVSDRLPACRRQRKLLQMIVTVQLINLRPLHVYRTRLRRKHRR